MLRHGTSRFVYDICLSNYSMVYSFISNYPFKVLMKTVMKSMFMDKVRSQLKVPLQSSAFVALNTNFLLLWFVMIVSE